MEHTIYCLACGSHRSTGGLENVPTQASEVLAQALHNPGCDLSHHKRDAPVIKRRVEGTVTIDTIQPGSWKDAEMILE